MWMDLENIMLSEQNKSDKKSQEPYDFTHVRYKTESGQSRQTKTHSHRQQDGGYQKEGDGRIVKDKGGQIYGDGRFTFGWWTHIAMYR